MMDGNRVVSESGDSFRVQVSLQSIPVVAVHDIEVVNVLVPGGVKGSAIDASARP